MPNPPDNPDNRRPVRANQQDSQPEPSKKTINDLPNKSNSPHYLEEPLSERTRASLARESTPKQKQIIALLIKMGFEFVYPENPLTPKEKQRLKNMYPEHIEDWDFIFAVLKYPVIVDRFTDHGDSINPLDSNGQLTRTGFRSILSEIFGPTFDQVWSANFAKANARQQLYLLYNIPEIASSQELTEQELLEKVNMVNNDSKHFGYYQAEIITLLRSLIPSSK